MRLPRSRTDSCRSYVPASLNPSEPDCRITYTWHRGERETPTCPGLPPQVEIVRVEVEGRDYLRTNEEAQLIWNYAVWEDVERWMGAIEAGEEDAAEARAERRAEMGRS